MSIPALLLDSDGAGEPLEPIARAAREAGLEMRRLSDIETALQDLRQHAAVSAHVPLVLLGPHLKNPLSTARQVHQVSPASYLILIADHPGVAQLRQAVTPVPMIGSDWSIVELDSSDLAGVLRTAVRATRQRQQLRTTLDRINIQLVSPPPADTSEHRRYMVSDRFLASILEHARDAIIATDEHGSVRAWNRAAEQLFGVKEHDALGQPIHALAAGPWAQRLPDLMAQLHAGRPLDAPHELMCRRPDGSLFEVELVLAQVREESGRQIGISAIVRDITQRKRAEQAVTESQRRLQSIIDNSTAVIYIKDLAGRYVLINRRYEELFHVTREGILSKTDYDLFAKAQADAFRANDLAALAADQPLESEEVAPQDDGPHTYISIKAALRDETGQPYAVCGISTDITQRKRDEEALRQSAERIRLIVESALDAVVTINQDGRVTEWNPQAELVFGWRREEIIGRAMVECLVPARYRDAHRAGLERFLHTREGPALNQRLELSALRKDGTEFPIELTISPVKLGQCYEFSAFVRDITQRKQFEDTLRDMNRQLELRVEERTGELARSNAALERSNLELLRFAYIASHDLQSPLRSISGFVQLLQKDYGARLDEKADHWINRIVENTRRMQSLIHDLLAYSRLDAQSEQMEPVNFHKVFDHAVGALDAAIGEARAEVTCGELPTVMGERSQLVQLLQNLIDNAIKYRGERAPRVHVAAERNDSDWLFSVQDNGIGIAPKHKERVFDIFHRLHTQQAYPGTGIGLAVCRRVVHRHGGELWVESTPGTGSVFYFTILDREETAT